MTLSRLKRLMLNNFGSVSSAASVLATFATLDYAYKGQPFAEGPHQAVTTLSGMDYCYMGEPFVRAAR